jgi:hypothetical protein
MPPNLNLCKPHIAKLSFEIKDTSKNILISNEKKVEELKFKSVSVTFNLL